MGHGRIGLDGGEEFGKGEASGSLDETSEAREDKTRQATQDKTRQVKSSLAKGKKKRQGALAE